MPDRRPVQGLDPHPTKLDLERKLREQAARGRQGAAETLAQLFGADAPPARKPPAPPGPSYLRMHVGEVTIERDGHVTSRTIESFVSVPGVGERKGRELRLVLPFPPRTKKNGGKGSFGGIRQKEAYRLYHRRVLRHLEEVKHILGLPLPDGEYNIAALYYVDRYGKPADRPGLDQGLFDALQDAGVVTDDWQFRTTDGTRIITDDPTPRVELTITPLPPK